MMGSLSIWHWLIIAAVVALVFGGGGKISGLMGDAAKGIKAFRDGMKDDHEPAKAPVDAAPLPRTEAVKPEDVKN